MIRDALRGRNAHVVQRCRRPGTAYLRPPAGVLPREIAHPPYRAERACAPPPAHRPTAPDPSTPRPAPPAAGPPAAPRPRGTAPPPDRAKRPCAPPHVHRPTAPDPFTTSHAHRGTSSYRSPPLPTGTTANPALLKRARSALSWSRTATGPAPAPLAAAATP